MGWVALALIGVAAAALLWRLGVARGLWSFVGAALMLGATGYALQGRPLQPGSPVAANAEPIEIDPAVVQLREAMLGHFTTDNSYFIASDAMTRAGDAGSAVAVMLGGVRKLPRSMALWTGLGSAYATHDAGAVSPAALFAFQQAMRLGPTHPAPPFFLGLAYVQAGRFAEARPCWARALELTPSGAPYRVEIAVRLMLLDRFLAMQAAPQPAPAE